jgi:hypothetical protein
MAAKEIRLNLTPSGGAVIVDGEALKGVTGVKVEHRVLGGPPRITVDLVGLEMSIGSDEAEVRVSEKVRAALVALGWTPPNGA